MNFHTRLKKFREEKGLTQEELAIAVGLKRGSSIGNFESTANDPGSFPPYLVFVNICNILNVSPIQLMQDDLNDDLTSTKFETAYAQLSKDEKRIVDYVLFGKDQCTECFRNLTEDIIYLPLVEQKASAGIGKDLYDQHAQFKNIAFPINKVPIGATHAVIIDGVSMQPKIFDGQIVYIDCRKECGDNEYGIFSVNTGDGDSTIYCKQYKFDSNGKPYLHSLNPNSGDPEFNPNDKVIIKCIGKIVGY